MWNRLQSVPALARSRLIQIAAHTTLSEVSLMIRNVLAALAVTALASACSAQVDPKWEIHDRNRPNPPVITAGTQDAPGKPPSDAIVLFDGKDLSKWVQKKDGSAAQWKVEN